MNKIPSIVLGSGFGKRVISELLIRNKNYNFLGILKRNNKKLERELFKTKKKILLFIATPPFTHYKYIEYFSKKNVYLICEKPLSSNLHQAKKINNSKNKILCINHQLRFSNITQFLKNKLKNKQIEQIEIFHRTNHSVKNRRTQDWWSKQKYGGGQLCALGPHFIDFVVFFTGKIKYLKCKTKTQRSSKQISDDFFSLNLMSKNNCQILIRSNSYTSCRENLKIKIRTTDKKKFTITNFEKLYLGKKIIFRQNRIKDKFISDNFWRVSFNNFLNKLSKYINKKNKKDYFCSVSQSFYIQEIIDKAFKSNKSGKAIFLK